MNISAQPQLSHSDRLRLLNAVNDLCLPWQVDLVLRYELPAEFSYQLCLPGATVNPSRRFQS